jgi:hypothetical protein
VSLHALPYIDRHAVIYRMYWTLAGSLPRSGRHPLRRHSGTASMILQSWNESNHMWCWCSQEVVSEEPGYFCRYSDYATGLTADE